MLKKYIKNNPHILEWCVPLMLLLVTFLAYGLFLREMSFFWDDWPSVWFQQIGGEEIFQQVFSSDRPLLGRLFMLTMPLFGASVLRWQFFAILMRGLCGVSFFWFLSLLWKGHLAEKTIAGLIFILYPGFQQQYVAVTYSHVFLVYILFLLSLCFMLLGLKNRRYFGLYYGLAVLFSLVAVFSAEYFIALEILRPLLIFWVLNPQKSSQDHGRPLKLGAWIRKVGLLWLPFLVSAGVFSYWRVFIHGFPRAQLLAPGDTQIVQSFLGLPLTMIQDLLEMTIGAWGQAFQPAILTDFNTILYVRSLWVIAVLAAVVLTIFLIRLNRHEYEMIGVQSVWGVRAVFLGGVALCLGAVPFWIVNIPYRLAFPYDRVALPVLFGASILMAGLLTLFINNPKIRYGVASVFIAVAMIYQWNVADTFIKESSDVKAFFWQLSWRIPQLEPDTIVLIPAWPFRFNTDNSLTALLNWVYDPDRQLKSDTARMPFLMMDLPARIGNSLPGTRDENTGRIRIDPAAPVQVEYRGLRFSGSTAGMLVLDFQPPACLRVLDPNVDREVFAYSPNTHAAVPLSNLEQISTSGEIKPALTYGLFGKEPKKDWCHYYEEAELARVDQRWQDITGIARSVFEEHRMTPQSAIEYLPFIEAYLRTGDVAKAADLSSRALDKDYSLSPLLCRMWKENTAEDTGSEQTAEAAAIMETAGCQQ